MSTVERALGGPAIEVVAKATRRRFTLEYKGKIVREADACKTLGAVGALLRREGLYSSHLATWRAAREQGDLLGARKKRGPAPRVTDSRDRVIAPHMYNAKHHHSGLGLLTPSDVHHGLAEQRVATRATVLATAYAAHPERFPSGLPQPPAPPVEVWINRPKTRALETRRPTPVLASPAIPGSPAILDPLRASG